MTIINENSPAADEGRDGIAKSARRDPLEEGNVVAFRRKPARPPTSHPPPPPTAA